MNKVQHLSFQVNINIQVLSDTEKRTLYDKFGTAGLHGGPSQEHGFGAADIARELFGAFGGGFRGFQPPPLMFQLDLSLEDLFNGRKLELSISDNTVSLDILPGMQDGMQLSARGKATDSRGFQRDLIFRINQHEHPIFHRKNADLMVELNISISEALFGFERNITMLDGNVLYFRSPSSRVVRPGDIFTIDGYGMPLFRQAPMRGNLFINIIFSMPNCIQLDDDSMSQLKGLLNNLTGESPSISSSSSEQETQSQSPERTSRKKSFHTLKEGNIRSYGKIGDQEDEDDENSFARFFFR